MAISVGSHAPLYIYLLYIHTGRGAIAYVAEGS